MTSTRTPIYGPIGLCQYNPTPNFPDLISKIINAHLGTQYIIDTLSGIITATNIIQQNNQQTQEPIKNFIWNGIIRDKTNNASICEISIRKIMCEDYEINACHNNCTTKLSITDGQNPWSTTKTFELQIFCIANISDILIEYIEQQISNQDVIQYASKTLGHPSQKYTHPTYNDRQTEEFVQIDYL